MQINILSNLSLLEKASVLQDLGLGHHMIQQQLLHIRRLEEVEEEEQGQPSRLYLYLEPVQPVRPPDLQPMD